MRFTVLFTDNEDFADKRQEFMANHLAFLKSNSDSIQAAGPMFHTDGTGAGGMWVVEAATAQDVTRLVEEDPFFPTGLRKAIEIREWRLVFEHGETKL